MSIEPVLLAVVAVSVSLYGTMIGAMLYAYTHPRRAELARCPRVTILKPIAGLDEDLAANLESFAHLDYPSFEILIGVADASDPALPALHAFVARHPELDVRILQTDEREALNPKVAQLIGLERHARGEILVVSDANVRVAPSYLMSLVAELSQPGVGLVSSVVAGTGEKTFGAALENLQLCAMIAPGVISSSVVADLSLTVGKSMAMWRRDLVRLGGFGSVGDVLAEDYVMGRRFRKQGYGVRVVLDPVENRNVACSFGRTLERHTRWAKMRRAIMPGAFAIEVLLTPIAVALGAALLSPSRATIAALLGCVAMQICGAALATRKVRGVPFRTSHLLLEPVRAVLLQVCWLRAALSRRVEWRGHPFIVGPDSRLISVQPTSARVFLTDRA